MKHLGFVLVLVLVFVLDLVLGGCRDRSKPALRRVSPPTDAASPPAPIDAAPTGFDIVDPSLLAGATLIPSAAELGLTDVGPDPSLHLLQRLGPIADHARSFTLVLVLRGARAYAVELGTYREAVLPTDLPDGTLLRIRPLDPPRPWGFEDSGFGEAPLPSVEPVHFAYRTHLPGEADTFAVVAVGRAAYAVHHLHTTNTDPGGPAWRQLVMITVGPTARRP